MGASRGPGIQTAATTCMHCPLTRNVSKDLLHGSQKNERKRASGPPNSSHLRISKVGKQRVWDWFLQLLQSLKHLEN